MKDEASLWNKSLCISQRTQTATIIKTNRIKLCAEIIDPYCEN